MYKAKYLQRYLQVSTPIAMNNNPSSKWIGVVFFAIRLSYRFSDLIVRMGSFLQLIPDFHFLFELLHHSSLEKNWIPPCLHFSLKYFPYTMYIALTCVSGSGVECTKLCLKLFSRCYIADVKLLISLFISDISYY